MQREGTHDTLASGERVGKVLESLLEVVDLLLVEPCHLGLGQLRHVVEVVSGVEHLAFGLVAKDDA